MKRQIGAELVARLKAMNDANEQTCPYVVGTVTRYCTLTPLTLTDDEREAVRFCVTASLPETEKLGGVAGGLCRMHAATLRGLLERTK
jgi:hypothetical protein